MTIRKYNAVARCTDLSKFPYTFETVMKAMIKQLGPVLDGMTARQIAAVVEFGYTQHTHGEMNAQ